MGRDRSIYLSLMVFLPSKSKASLPCPGSECHEHVRFLCPGFRTCRSRRIRQWYARGRHLFFIDPRLDPIGVEAPASSDFEGRDALLSAAVEPLFCPLRDSSRSNAEPLGKLVGCEKFFSRCQHLRAPLLAVLIAGFGGRLIFRSINSLQNHDTHNVDLLP